MITKYVAEESESDHRVLEYGYDTPTVKHQNETWFRYGYRIGDGKPLMISDFGRSELQASKLAQARAVEVAAKLRKLGSQEQVVAWVQEWKSQTVITYADALVVVS